MSTPGQKVSDIVLGKSREIALKIMKRLGQSENHDTKLWMCLVVKVKFNPVKNNIALKPEMLGP